MISMEMGEHRMEGETLAFHQGTLGAHGSQLAIYRYETRSDGAGTP